MVRSLPWPCSPGTHQASQRIYTCFGLKARKPRRKVPLSNGAQRRVRSSQGQPVGFGKSETDGTPLISGRCRVVALSAEPRNHAWRSLVAQKEDLPLFSHGFVRPRKTRYAIGWFQHLFKFHTPPRRLLAGRA